MVGNIYVVVGWCDVFICYYIIKCFVFIFCILDSFYFFFCIVVQFLVWESKIMYGDFQCVVVCYLFMQFVVVIIGNISKYGDDVFFLWCFINDYFFFKCI